MSSHSVHMKKFIKGALSLLMSVSMVLTMTMPMGHIAYAQNDKQTGPTKPMKAHPNVLANETTELKGGEVRLKKTAEPVPGKVNTWKITVRVESKDYPKPVDLLLTMDRSGSMDEGKKQNQKEGPKMINARAAASDITKRLLYEGAPHRVALHTYSAYDYQNYSNKWQEFTDHTGGFITDKEKILSEISGLKAGGGTFTQRAIHEAGPLFAEAKKEDTKNERERAMILITDGRPTLGYGVDLSKVDPSKFWKWQTGIKTNLPVPETNNYYIQKSRKQGFGYIPLPKRGCLCINFRHSTKCIYL